MVEPIKIEAIKSGVPVMELHTAIEPDNTPIMTTYTIEFFKLESGEFSVTSATSVWSRD